LPQDDPDTRAATQSDLKGRSNAVVPRPLEIDDRREIGRLRRLGAADRRAHAATDGKTETRLAKGVEQKARDRLHSSTPDGLAMAPGRTRRRIHSEAHINAERQHDAAPRLRGRAASNDGVGTIFGIRASRLLSDSSGGYQKNERREREVLHRARARHNA
jgi:hypothetical protein